jgi:magnesium chelatase subunit I
VDKRSGVSQRLPISTHGAGYLQCRTPRSHSTGKNWHRSPASADIYTALPGITGKIELEYEGEMRGADTVVREIIRISPSRAGLRQIFCRDQHPAD